MVVETQGSAPVNGSRWQLWHTAIYHDRTRYADREDPGLDLQFRMV